MKLSATKRWLIWGILLGVTLFAAFEVSQVEQESVAPSQPNSVNKQATLAATTPTNQASESSPDSAAEPVASSAPQWQHLTRRTPEDSRLNAFASKSWTPPPPPPPPAPVEPPPPPPPPPTAPPLPFTYLGRFENGDNGVVTVYLQQGERAYNVKVGDVIDDQYRVDAIDATQIVLTYLALNIQQILAIGTA